MGLLRLCKISEMPQLGWECPGVSYWVWQNFEKEKEERESRGRERERGGERQTDREEGRRGEQNKNNEKKSKHWFAVTYCQNCDAPFFPIPGAHLDCVVTCFTCLLVLAFIGWAVFGNGQVEWKVFRNFRLNIVSLDFSPGGTYYLQKPIKVMKNVQTNLKSLAISLQLCFCKSYIKQT